MKEARSTARRLILGMPLALMLAACSDSTGLDKTEFDALETAASVQNVTSVAGAEGDALIGLGLAGEALASHGGASAALVPSRSGGEGLLPGAEAARRLALDPAAMFPSNLLGKTLVYDVEAEQYVVDEAASGAPEDGVRFLYYAINPVTGRPAAPLNQLGYLDLIDQSTPASTRLGIRVVDTSGGTEVELLDYYIDVSYEQTSERVDVFLKAVGSVSDGSKTLEFDLDRTASFTEGSESFDFAVDHTLSVAGTNNSINLRGEAAIPVGDEEPATFTATMTIRHGGNEAVLEATVAESGALSGELTHNGVTAVVLGGTTDAPSFTRADGSALSAAELEALDDVWEAVEGVFDFAEQVFSPSDE